MYFADRVEAGRRLAEALAKESPLTDGPRLVAALPRGGVVVGAQVAQALGLPLDVLVTRKIGAPGQPEVAIGAVTQDGTVLLNETMLAWAGVSSAYLEAERQRQLAEIERRLLSLRDNQSPADWRGREVIVVDDGIATGFTVRAAIKGLRAEGAAAVWLAVPVAPAETAAELAEEVDRLVVLYTPVDFYAVGQFYQDFQQVEDMEVKALLARCARIAGPTPQNTTEGGGQMLKHRVALDSGLANYRPLLRNEGFEVIDLPARGPGEAEAILLSGLDRNITGNETRASKAFVLDVSGRQPEEVLYDLHKHFTLAEGGDDSPAGPD